MDILKTKSQRYIIAYYLQSVIDQKMSFSAKYINKHNLTDKNKAFVNNSIFGCLRHYNQLDFIVKQLMSKPLNGKLRIIHFIIIQAIYQLCNLNKADHAAVFETVEACKQIDPKFANLVNGVLRNFLRRKNELEEQAKEINLLPTWLLEELQKFYPSNYQLIEKNSEEKAPLWIRVNTEKTTSKEFSELLIKQNIDFSVHPVLDSAIHIKKFENIENLPGFTEGLFTVQDLHAQFASIILNPNEKSIILDACAAPGGKTAHLANLEPTAKIIALDLDATRAEKIKETIKRLDIKNISIQIGDASKSKKIFLNQKFTHILLDVPCSATGVIRKNPDIRWLRKASDIKELARLQYSILCENWDLLEVGGYLLYTTCSILPTENQLVIGRFLNSFGNAAVIELDDFVEEYIPRHTSVIDNYDFGLQLLPSHNYGDGFYYCLLQKLI